MAENNEQITYFAATNSRGREVAFGIKRKDRARHMYVIGKTGMGKSTLLENMAIQDVRNGEGMAFIDPHGSTAERILEYVPEHRIKDVLYFAPFDMEYPIAFNVMEDVGYDKRHLVVSGLLSAFRKIWVDAWSARMEYILSNTLLALLEYPGATLLDVNRMLVNKSFRKKVVDNVKDPLVRSFWVDEFATYTDRYTQEATPAIQNKIGQFTSNPLIRNIVGQPKSSFDIRKMMDEKKILIINLSKGRVGEVNATLLGSMLVTKIYLAAMSRADVASGVLTNLPSFYFYVDEFQSFANQSFADILSEARKYKLNLIIAHQYIEQMEEEVRDAVFGNVGTTVAFRVGPFDAEVLETVFMPTFTKTDLVNLGFAQIYLTLMIDGVGSPPFSATTLQPFDAPPQTFSEIVIKTSREQFGKQRTEVEGAIEKWTSIERDEAPPSKPREPLGRRPAGEVRRDFAPRDSYRAPREERRGSREDPPFEARPEVPRREPRQEQHRDRPMRPREEERESPPLHGAKSLREALSAVTQRPPPQPPQDLKGMLGHVAPKAVAPKPEVPRAESNPLEQKSGPKPAITAGEGDPRTFVREDLTKTNLKPAELPEDELRSMLAVDEISEKHS